MRTNPFRIRKLTTNSHGGDSYGITIPYKVAQQNLGIHFYIEQANSEIIVLKSGCSPKEVEK